MRHGHGWQEGGAAGVVVKGTLAFVAASGVARVVSVDVRRETNPAVLSSVRLSAASTVALHGEARGLHSFVRSFNSFIHSFTYQSFFFRFSLVEARRPRLDA